MNLNPMAAFGVGKEIGTANSPISGLREVITNLVEDAKKKGLLQMEHRLETAGAVDKATALEPFKRRQAEFESQLATKQAAGTAEATLPFKKEEKEFGADVDVRAAVDKAKALLPIDVEQAEKEAAVTLPYKKEATQAQAEAQGAQTRLTAKEKFDRQGDIISAAGQQPEPEVFRDEATGKTMTRNWTYDPDTRQWVSKISPASFNLLERVMGGTTPGATTPLDDAVNKIFENLFVEE